MKTTPGTTLFSTEDSTSVVVIRWEVGDDAVLTCGSATMTDEAPSSPPAPPSTGAVTLLGKRYCTADGLVELLCTRTGTGGLAVDGTELEIKSATPLPASD